MESKNKNWLILLSIVLASFLLFGCTGSDNNKSSQNLDNNNSNNSLNTPINCVDINCFIEASKNCSKATWTSEYETSFEIKGIQNSKCIVYRGTPMNDECPFETSELTSMLERWTQGNFSTNDWQTCSQQWKELTPPDKNEPCAENWSCNPWANCINGTQTRTCFDFAQCGTDINKPEENQSCVNACIESWSCGAWSACYKSSETRTCTDSRNCGTTTNKPPTTQTCTQTCTENWTCGVWESCTNGTQTRICTDSSNCGTTINKPVINQTCIQTCTENWTCTEWNTCINNSQTRVCSDASNCGTTTSKPSETQQCSADAISVSWSSVEGNKYYDPKVTINGQEHTPYAYPPTPSHWCQLVPDRSYSGSVMSTNSGVKGERMKWDDSTWVIVPSSNHNSDYPTMFECN